MPQLSLDFARVAIPGYPNYTIDRNGAVYNQKGEPLKGDVAGGYYKVSLTNGKREYIHRLVLLTFIGPCPEGFQGCHKNSNRSDNRLANLTWGSRKRNARDRKKLGYHRSRGLSTEQKQRARYLYEVEGLSFEKLHRKFNIDLRTARRYGKQGNWRRGIGQLLLHPNSQRRQGQGTENTQGDRAA